MLFDLRKIRFRSRKHSFHLPIFRFVAFPHKKCFRLNKRKKAGKHDETGEAHDFDEPKHDRFSRGERLRGAVLKDEENVASWRAGLRRDFRGRAAEETLLASGVTSS